MTEGVRTALHAIAALTSANGCWAGDPIAGKAIFERIRHATPPYVRRIGVAADH